MWLLVTPPALWLLRRLLALAPLLHTCLEGVLLMLLLLVLTHEEPVAKLLPAPGRAARPHHRAQ